MTTRRSLFVTGVVLAVGVLLAPQAAFAQPLEVDASSGLAAGSIDVSWDPPQQNPEDVDSYQITWVKTIGTDVAVPPTSPLPSMLNEVLSHVVRHTITGLDGGESYTVAVRAVSGNDRSPWAVFDTVVLATASVGTLAPPMGIEAMVGEESGVVTVSWQAVTDATKYMVEWKTASQTYGATSRQMTVMAPMVEAEVDDLENGTEYMFQVSTGNAGGYGDPSAEVKATPTMGAAGGMGAQPGPIYLTPQGRDKIRVDWRYDETADNASSSVRFDVGWTDADGLMFTESLAPQTVQAAPNGREARHFVLKDLKVDQDYLVAVRAVHATATGTAIPAVVGDWRYRATPREWTPARSKTPQNLQVMAGDGELMVSWDEVDTVMDCGSAYTNSAPCGYRVEWRAANEGYDNPARQEDLTHGERTLGTSHTIPNLMNGTEYYVIVKSRNERSRAFSDASVEARQTPMKPVVEPEPEPEPGAPAAAPTAVEATAGDGMVSVSWEAVEGATKYMVEWRTAAQTYGAADRQAMTTSMMHEVDDLENGMEYMFRVKAGNDVGYGSASDEVTAMPMMPTPALPVFGVLGLGAGLVAAGRRRLRARRQPRLLKA